MTQAKGARGTGQFEGYTWDGRRWVADDGTVGRFDPWQRTSLPLRIGLVLVAVAGVVYLAYQLG
jgi:hypothetical protein